MTLDVGRFWEENRLCEGRPFRTDKPRCPIGYWLDDHWLLEEMRLPSTVRYYTDLDYRAAVNKACNERTNPALGRRFFAEEPQPPGPLRIEQVFGCRWEHTERATPWLEPGVQTLDDLRQLLDRIERMSDAELREMVLAGAGPVAKQPLNPDGTRKAWGAYSRGPATVGTSVLGTMNWLWWMVDEPAIMGRFYETLAQTLIRYQHAMEVAQNVLFRGYGWADDNCALCSPELYERYCLPMMQRVFAEFAPRPEDRRHQHSDSAMAHLLPILSHLEFHGVNLGPTIPAQQIRRHMPRTVIDGQVAPMTVRNGTREDIVAEVKRDFAAVGADGGLHVCTAGSIAGGTSLEKIRWFMEAVQEHTRYGR